MYAYLGQKNCQHQLLLHKQITIYPQMAEMQRYCLLVNDTPRIGEKTLWFVKGVNFMPARQMGIRTQPQKVCDRFSIVLSLEVKLLSWCFRFNAETNTVDFTIHIVIHDNVPPIELTHLTSIVPTPDAVLQNLMLNHIPPLSFNIFNPVDVHEFLVGWADGETQTVVALAIEGGHLMVLVDARPMRLEDRLHHQSPELWCFHPFQDCKWWYRIPFPNR
jgi:hypothetical protein